ncbi:MAG TPA: hypothetical protein VLC51_05025 [Nitrospira sp.]|nr:hypothetical protein [Nitrospira sp.]
MTISKNTYWREKLNEILVTEVAINQGSISADGAVVNWLAGVVHSRYIGLVREGVRIKMLDRINLRAKWPTGKPQHFADGQHVIATIPAEAVRLEAGMFRRSRQRWNRWIGRIVLIEHREPGLLYTVKVHREEWTLKSLGPVLGAEQPSKPWDIVNVVIDPQAVEVSIANPYLMRLT